MIEQPFSKKNEYYDHRFSNLNIPNIIVEKKRFEGCHFINVNLSESKLIRCKFVNCEFVNCNLSTVEFDASTLTEITFSESKTMGINWTKLNWPHIKLHSSLQFYKSILNHSGFYGLELKELVIEECTAHDVDFRTADLSYADFRLTDFEKSQFVNTNLYAADLTEAYNYRIDPTQNNIRRAKFSLPDAIHLLDAFDIEVN